MAISEDQNNWVIIDNDSSDSATIIQVGNARHEILIETIRTLANLKLVIAKAYVTCEDGFFMDVFHVMDEYGQKIQDEKVPGLCEAVAAEKQFINIAKEAIEVVTRDGYSVIRLRGIDRMGLLYEISEVLRHQGCHIVNADIWTHKHHALATICIVDDITGVGIKDSKRVVRIKKALGHVIKPIKYRSSSSSSLRLKPKICRIYEVNTRNEEIVEISNEEGWSSKGHVTVLDCKERNYTLVEIRSDDRGKLLLDTLTALMVMQYVVFHGAVTLGMMAMHQEYYIRHINGSPIRTIRERMQLKEFLEETINSPDSEEVELEIRTDGQLIHLSEILTAFKDKGCWIRRARIYFVNGKAKHNFWITDTSGKAIDTSIMNSIQEQMGESVQLVKKKSGCSPLTFHRKAKGCFFDNPLRHIAEVITNFFSSNNHSA